MTKKVFALILSLVLFLLCFSVTAGALSEGDSYSQSETIRYSYLSRLPFVRVAQFMPKNKTITIPAVFEGRPVAVIEAGAITTAPLTHIYVAEDNMFFVDIDGIVYDRSRTVLVRVPHDRSGRIVIPEGVVSIASGAFADCKKITEVILPNSLKEIEYWAFKNCSALKKIVIPESVEIIEFDCFEGCTSVNEIQIKNPLLQLEKDAFIDTAFYKNSSNWENGVLYAGKVLLATNDSLPVKYTIKEGTTMIASYAFSQRKQLESMYLPDSIKNIGDAAFMNCTALYDVRMPEVGCYIGGSVFDGTYLGRSTKQSLYVGKHLIRMYNGYAKINEGTLSVAKHAIPSNASVGLLQIPASLTTLSMPIMSFESTLSAIQLDPSNQTFSLENGVLYDKAKKKLVLCSTSATRLKVPETVECIGKYAFYECRKLVELNLPNSLQTIEANAFDTCVLLPKLVIPDQVTYVGHDATRNCCDLQNIKIGKGMRRAHIATFASEFEGYVDLPYEAEYISTGNLWGATTLLVADNSFGLEFAKAYHIPYQINKEGPKPQPVAPKPQSVTPKPESAPSASEETPISSQPEAVPPPVEAPVETIGAVVATPTETATDLPHDGAGWIWFAVGGGVVLVAAGAGWWLYQKKKSPKTK